MPANIFKAAATLALLPMLGGCVAAVAAIPVLAGGSVVATDRGESDKREPSAVPPPPFAGDANERAVAARSTAVPEIEAPPPALREPIGNDQAAAVQPVVATVEDPPVASPANDETAALTRPAAGFDTASNASAATANDRLGANPYDAFYAHAAGQARLDPVDDPRASAILATPGSLSPIMSDCAIRPPAVLIDLDRGDEAIDLDQPVSPNSELAEALAALRAQNVAVFWISAASAADAGKLRDRLLVSGLDPWRRDGLLLMRRADDRKQIRRRELSEMHCVVAIAGDHKGDFDELFDYLKNPSAAQPLDALIGEGWFLTPPPFKPEEN